MNCLPFPVVTLTDWKTEERFWKSIQKSNFLLAHDLKSSLNSVQQKVQEERTLEGDSKLIQ